MSKCKWCKEELYLDEDLGEIMKVKLLTDKGKWEKCCFQKQWFEYVKHYSPNIQIWKAKYTDEMYILQVIE